MMTQTPDGLRRSPKPRSSITAATPPVSTAPMRERLAYHEAGHAIVGRLLGDFEISAIIAAVLYPGANTDGRAAHTEFSGTDYSTAHLPASAMWAGVVAEARLLHGPGCGGIYAIQNLLDSSGASDRRAMVAAAGEVTLDGVDDARKVVEAQWPAITKLATALLASSRVGDADVLRSLGIDPTKPEDEISSALQLRRRAALNPRGM